jgi:hypothetical protein
MARTQMQQSERETIMARAEEVGPTAAAREHGLKASTVQSWMRRAGRVATVDERSVSAQLAIATVAERKAKLAEDLLDDAQRLRAQLFSACVERKAMTVSDGAAFGSHVEVVDIKLTHPPFSDQRQIMTSIAIAVDKIQILTGEATERIETLAAGAAPTERRQRANTAIDELAARRAS